jgi:hypothetical protein
MLEAPARAGGRVTPALIVGLAGAVWTFAVWRSGGNVWPSERPHFLLTVASTGLMCACFAAMNLFGKGWGRTVLAGAGLVAAVTAFIGEGVIERLAFDDRRAALDRELTQVLAGRPCQTPCEIEALKPARIVFRLTGDGKHWSGVCYDASDTIGLVGKAYSVHPPLDSERALVEEAKRMFGGAIRWAPSWKDHWYGCSTRP